MTTLHKVTFKVPVSEIINLASGKKANLMLTKANCLWDVFVTLGKNGTVFLAVTLVEIEHLEAVRAVLAKENIETYVTPYKTN